MPRSDSRNSGEWAKFFAALLLAGFVFAWATIPVTVLEATWQAERRQMSAWVGEGAETWLAAQSTASVHAVAHDASQTAGKFTGSTLERWLTDRLCVSLLWTRLMVYRALGFLLWGLLGMPLLLATFADGLLVREIRKTAFVSQSPIRHKVGVHSLRLIGIGMLFWLCAPWPMPLGVAPAAVMFVAVALWLWLGHLQKRL